MLENLHKESFDEHLKTPFQIKRDGVPDLVVELHNITGPGVRGQQETFTLVFRGPLEVELEQGLYTLVHEQIGQFDLFLVPFARKPDGMRYEAVFNRLVD